MNYHDYLVWGVILIIILLQLYFFSKNFNAISNYKQSLSQVDDLEIKTNKKERKDEDKDDDNAKDLAKEIAKTKDIAKEIATPKEPQTPLLFPRHSSEQMKFNKGIDITKTHAPK
ncbi:hypothetical protein NMK71_05010 [Weeksellaceae bacterium KMM 9713]|uniref:Uncharacterized protein n=1 Tax=Profundicola chukchiensis TaxID=2961959 RepID=A0A9X4RUK4_9FLAO|nr:hypothetical protein [Profundicola chukchiensis]MDG4945766.1 hypothetical protein [Profundicola chukchiensis]